MEQKRLIILCDKDGKRPDGAAPPPSMECRLTELEMANLREQIAAGKSFEDMMKAIGIVAGPEALEAIQGKTVAFVTVEGAEVPSSQRVVLLSEEEKPGVIMSLYEDCGFYRLQFTPSNEQGFFIGSEMARRELTKLMTTTPREISDALEIQRRRVLALRAALEALAETIAIRESPDLTKFISTVLAKDELS